MRWEAEGEGRKVTRREGQEAGRGRQEGHEAGGGGEGREVTRQEAEGEGGKVTITAEHTGTPFPLRTGPRSSRSCGEIETCHQRVPCSTRATGSQSQAVLTERGTPTPARCPAAGLHPGSAAHHIPSHSLESPQNRWGRTVLSSGTAPSPHPSPLSTSEVLAGRGQGPPISLLHRGAGRRRGLGTPRGWAWTPAGPAAGVQAGRPSSSLPSQAFPGRAPRGTQAGPRSQALP